MQQLFQESPLKQLRRWVLVMRKVEEEAEEGAVEEENVVNL
jgi:hypothetical protein